VEHVWCLGDHDVVPWQMVVVMVTFASILDLDEIQVIVVGE
jgi:hypothetical protein